MKESTLQVSNAPPPSRNLSNFTGKKGTSGSMHLYGCFFNTLLDKDNSKLKWMKS